MFIAEYIYIHIVEETRQNCIFRIEQNKVENVVNDQKYTP